MVFRAAGAVESGSLIAPAQAPTVYVAVFTCTFTPYVPGANVAS